MTSFQDKIKELKERESKAKEVLKKKGFDVLKVTIKTDVCNIIQSNGLTVSMSRNNFRTLTGV